MKIQLEEAFKMFTDKPELSITIPSKTKLLKMLVELTKHIATINNFLPTDTQKIALAVDEAITNVIKHSYKYKKNKKIKIEYFIHQNGIKIRIVFSGIPPVFDGIDVNLNKMIKAKKKGGLGVELIKRIMDFVEYRTIDDTNYCEMVKWKRKN